MESKRRELLANPCETANFWSRLFYTWFIPTYSKGYRRELVMDDVYRPLNEDRSDCLGDRLEKVWIKRRGKSKSTPLILVVFRTFWKELLTASCLFGLQNIVLRIGQSMLLGQFLQYFRENSDKSYMDALIFGNGIVLLNAINAITANYFNTLGWVNGMKVRIAMSSLIYRKSLRLAQTALGVTGPGKIVNLISNDVNRFQYLSLSWDALWAAPLLSLAVGILLWRDIGWAGLAGVSVIIFAVLIQIYSAALLSRSRSKMAFRSDERIRFMDEIIGGIQVIKMYAWEMPFAKLIALARKMELKQVKMCNYVRGVQVAFSAFLSQSAVFCTLLTITLLFGTDQITAAKVFEITSYFLALTYLLSDRLVLAVTELSESLVGFRRLQKFLELDEKELNECDDHSNDRPSFAGDVSVSLKNVTACWKQPNVPNQKTEGQIMEDTDIEQNTTVLDDLSVEFGKAKLVGIIGAVGAGKSSLLQAILRELPLESGSIRINGTISYASQEPWLFSETIRQNILFGQEYEKDRYNAVVEACALTADFEQLPDRDRSVVGERGIMLSGGQKARINLARAIYRRSDIYLLDDPLSAVDAHVAAHIFSKCFGPIGRLARRNATRIVVTHQVHFLEAADWIIVLDKGKITIQGTPQYLNKNGIDFVARDSDKSDTIDQQGSPEGSQLSEDMTRKGSIGSICTDSSVSNGNNEDIQLQFVAQLEESLRGNIKGSILMNYFKAGAHWSIQHLLLFTFLVTQIVASASDIWLSIWVKSEQERTLRRDLETKSGFDGSPLESSTFWRRITSEQTTEFYIDTYTILISAVILLALLRSFGFFLFCGRASQRLHDGMFKGLISTKMRFFNTNPSGRMLNRFANDIGVIDTVLPKNMLDSAQIILRMVGVFVVVATVSPVLMIPIFLMGVIFIFLLKSFLKVSRCLKHLEAKTNSPVFTHLVATLTGLSTIRSYHAENILAKEFDYHQDVHTSCWYMFIIASSGFGMSLDIMLAIFMACIVYFFIVFDDGDSASDNKIGLAITQILSMTEMLQWGVRQCAAVNNKLTAVQRVFEYRDLEPEPQPEKPTDIEKDWPTNGCIELRNMFYRYFADADPVLHDLSFVIEPKEKIGIVGRTGAGKSSLIGALFRLACIEGDIVIDGVDTSSVSLKRLRSSIAIIPQDPVLFSGTLRRNLDPFEEYADADIWSALENVELKEIASGQLGLNSPVMANGSNFSVGQRQLICLARAILRKNRILVLDEATANVDPKTDLLIQKTIREKFVECTVLTIAHRLHTIIDSDRVLVMDAGRVIEFDDAHSLLDDDQGTFNGMVRALGPTEYKRLAQVAQEKFDAKCDVQYYQTYL